MLSCNPKCHYWILPFSSPTILPLKHTFSLQTSDPSAFSTVSSYNPEEQTPTSLWSSLGYKALLFDPRLQQKTSSSSFLQLPNSTSCFHWEQGKKMACYFSSPPFTPVRTTDCPRKEQTRSHAKEPHIWSHVLLLQRSGQQIKHRVGKRTLNVVSLLQMQMQTVLFVVHSTAKHKLLLHFTTSPPFTLQPWTQNRIMLVSCWFRTPDRLAH